MRNITQPASRHSGGVLGFSNGLRTLIFCGALLGVSLQGVSISYGQCAFEWKPEELLPDLNGPVFAIAGYDDGSGPALYVGGNFSTAGGVPVSNIARWDGANWSSVGSGMNNTIRALIVYDGALVAGGYFTAADGASANFIAQWNGTTWSPLSTGMNNYIYALTVYNNELIAGGAFTIAGGVSANRIAKWNPGDGGSWSPLGAGMNNSVRALTVLNSDLIAGGDFTIAGDVAANRVAKWSADGPGAWASLGAGTNNVVFALTVYKGELIAGGSFSIAGLVGANHIARWNPAGSGTWSALGSGTGNRVTALTVYNEELIAGGNFSTSKWNGTSWSVFGNTAPSPVYALAAYDGTLFAGGYPVNVPQGFLGAIAAWNPGVPGRWAWLSEDSTNGEVLALTRYNGDVIAGGRFTRMGFVRANHIARWNPSVPGSWSPMGSGLSVELSAHVNALQEYNGTLIAGGSFTIPGQGLNIAQWHADTESWSGLGTGLNGSVYALAIYDGELIAGGDFTIAGGTGANNIARWDGLSWSPMGDGMNAAVRALTVYGATLIAGGDFTTAGGSSANHIAEWNNVSESWSAMGSGMNSHVLALTVYNNALIAGGNFIVTGFGVKSHVAKWNPGVPGFWSPLGQGTGDVYALSVYNGELIAGGLFAAQPSTYRDFVTYHTVAKAGNGSQFIWSALSGYFNDRVNALLTYNEELFIGKAFIKTWQSNGVYWARGSYGPDTDGDGVADCGDSCPNDPNKTTPDLNGCGEPESSETRHITQWRSIRTHGLLGDLAIVIDPSRTGNGSSGPTVETRGTANLGLGIQKIEVEFDGPVTLANSAEISVMGYRMSQADGLVFGQISSYTPTSVQMSGPNTLQLIFSSGALPDQACYAISIGPNTFAESLIGDLDCNIRSLNGDVNGSGGVSITDVVKTKFNIGQFSASFPGMDIDLSGGTINLEDMLIVKSLNTFPSGEALCP